MTKIERFEAIGRVLFWGKKKTLVVGDMHLGYEEYLAERGIAVPRSLVGETIEDLRKIFAKTGKLKEVVLLGDVKHYYAGILSSEFSDVKKIFKLIRENLIEDGKIIIVKGNHDASLEPITREIRGVELVDRYVLDDVMFLHGNKDSIKKAGLELYDKKIKLIVVGHIHPAVYLREDEKVEKYKCFVYGKWKRKKFIVVPSFFSLVEGLDISENHKVDDFDFSDFRAFLVADRVYDFGKISRLG